MNDKYNVGEILPPYSAVICRQWKLARLKLRIIGTLREGGDSILNPGRVTKGKIPMKFEEQEVRLHFKWSVVWCLPLETAVCVCPGNWTKTIP